MFSRCRSTVLRLSIRLSAISRLRRPSDNSASTSISRPVRPYRVPLSEDLAVEPRQGIVEAQFSEDGLRPRLHGRRLCKIAAPSPPCPHFCVVDIRVGQLPAGLTLFQFAQRLFEMLNGLLPHPQSSCQAAEHALHRGGACRKKHGASFRHKGVVALPPKIGRFQTGHDVAEHAAGGGISWRCVDEGRIRPDKVFGLFYVAEIDHYAP